MQEKKHGRKRYIAFEFIDGGEDIGKKALSKAIEEKQMRLGLELRFEILVINGRRGLLRTSNKYDLALRELINSLTMEESGFTMKTLRTSGTILTLKQKYFKDQRI